MVIKLALKINFVDITLEGDNVIMGNVNRYLKGIGLKTIFKKFCGKRKKQFNHFDDFLYFL